ncbi:hypothetical protein [Actinacidiphila glaucinigra]|uniref:hypothetical protein n=1 Tax=Actinacidiphila glaucinigra TaxID=235986 RepID=UPI002E3045FF|nr:hypothetical protein [Actinacidiphila glaucinigra]
MTERGPSSPETCDTRPFLQVVWPNRDGAYPWQPGGEDLIDRQPRLDLHPDKHPAGVWTQDL